MQAAPRRVVFAEGEEERAIRAALAFRAQGFGTPVLVGRGAIVRGQMERLGIAPGEPLEIHNAALSEDNAQYIAMLYERLQRQGHLQRDVQRHACTRTAICFAACMVAAGAADAMVTGLTRSFQVSFGACARCWSPLPIQRPAG